jgi:hypothetical protein
VEPLGIELTREGEDLVCGERHRARLELVADGEVLEILLHTKCLYHVLSTPSQIATGCLDSPLWGQAKLHTLAAPRAGLRRNPGSG